MTTTSDLLKACVGAARKSADERARIGEAETVRRAEARVAGGVGFAESLSRAGVRVIAECKRRSPSRGIIRRDYDPVAIALGYAEAGAAAISVLTESTFFDGSLDHLAAVRAAVDLPLLRKDFIVTEFQVIEARAAGADAILLIVGALSVQDLRRLIAFASGQGLAALVEVHDRAELETALAAGATIVGVNSRNLRTLEVSPAMFDELAPLMPAPVVAVAESGLRTADDVIRLRGLGYRAFLIGERFMGESDPGAALAALLSAARLETRA